MTEEIVASGETLIECRALDVVAGPMRLGFLVEAEHGGVGPKHLKWLALRLMGDTWTIEGAHASPHEALEALKEASGCT